METQFTAEQMQALAVVLNHVEGKHEFDAKQLDAAVQLADKLWQEMQRQWRIANPTAL